MKNVLLSEIKVFAPATIANIGPGFDIFGLAINGIGDEVEVKSNSSISNFNILEIKNNSDLPIDENNVVVGVGNYLLSDYQRKENIKLGVDSILNKNMKIGTGMGSSASSSVASAVAINYLLNNYYRKDSKEMFEAIKLGEAMATKSDVGHPDNVFPSLLGGFVFIYDSKRNKYVRFEISENIYFAIVSPDIVVNTSEARMALNKVPYNIPKLVSLTSKILKRYYLNNNLKIRDDDLCNIVKIGGSIEEVRRYIEGAIKVFDGLRNNDINILGEGVMSDGIVTPVRSEFIKSYDDVKKIALDNGAKGFSISGSGPALFAVCDNKEVAHNIGKKMQSIFTQNKINSQIYISNVNNLGARLV